MITAPLQTSYNLTSLVGLLMDSLTHPWKLEDAKARFSELVRLAREVVPQRVTVYGKDAVVVISTEEYTRLLPTTQEPNLHRLLSTSPLAKLEFMPQPEYSPVREFEL
jgi:prevent-host-death family protein